MFAKADKESHARTTCGSTTTRKGSPRCVDTYGVPFLSGFTFSRQSPIISIGKTPSSPHYINPLTTPNLICTAHFKTPEGCPTPLKYAGDGSKKLQRQLQISTYPLQILYPCYPSLEASNLASFSDMPQRSFNFCIPGPITV